MLIKRIWIDMKKSILIFFSIFPLVAIAQEVKIFEYPKFHLAAEVGVGFLAGTTIKPDAIRENQSYNFDNSYYHDDFYCGFVFDYYTTPHYYVGVKPEISITNSISIAAGVRFLGSNYTLNSDRNYFLWKVSEKDLITNYVRITDIKQNSLYIGIPIEMLVYTYKRDIRFRHFFKWGTSLNFLLWSKTTPYFENAAMNKYADKVKNDIEKRDRFTPTGFIGMGFKIGRMNRPFGTFEFRMPFVLKENTGFSSFAESSVGFEFQTSINFPTGKKKMTCIY